MALGKRFFLFLLMLALTLLLLRTYRRYGDPVLYITFFDVGQGDAALIRFPGGTSMLVDAGGGFEAWDVGARELFPELARLGILSLDVAFLTHPDQDHGYGFRGLFHELEVKELWLNQSFQEERPRKPLLGELLGLAALENAKVVGISKRTKLTIAGVGLEMIPLATAGAKTNNRSLVLLLERAGCRALFTGDIEASAEEALAGLLPTVSLLKVAHHGSKTSSTENFLARTRPRWAVISAGMRNRYGHPNAGVVQRLKRRNAEVFRTDFHGFVEFAFSSNGKVACRTSHGSCGVALCP